MDYVLLIYESAKAFENRDEIARTDEYAGAWRAYYQSIVDAGIYVGGNPLDVPEAATTVRRRDDKRLIQDGPYANTKEQLGGFMILDLPSLDAAIEWASRCPATEYGAVEVRPVSLPTHQRVTSGIT
jgi:hypothetical protein